MFNSLLIIKNHKGLKMSRRKIEMYEYRHIVYQLQQGESIRTIAKSGLAGRNKVTEIKNIATKQGWLMPDASLPDEERLANFFNNTPKESRSKASPYRDKIINFLSEGISGKVIFRYLVEEENYCGSYENLQRYIRQLKLSTCEEEMTVPLTFDIAEAAQIDFGKGPDIHDHRVDKIVPTWFFVMTLCWSRHQYAELVRRQDIETWLICHQHAFDWFGGIPKKLIIDNPKCAITKACYYQPTTQRSYKELAQSYGFIISACPPREPKKKGRVESGVKYVKRNFMPLRSFNDLHDANNQLRQWVTEIAGKRIHGSTFEQPLNRFYEKEKEKLIPLPITPPEIVTWKKVSLYRDCHVRYDRCQYSAPYDLFHESLWLKISATSIAIYHKHKQVALHPRLFQPGTCSTKIEHLPPKAKFYLKRDAHWCSTESKKVGPNCQFVIESLLTDPVNDLLRQAQSILSLHQKVGFARLEKACQQAKELSIFSYHAIKKILKAEKLTNYVSVTKEKDSILNPVYQGNAHYQRNINTNN
jgi:transposase